MLKLLIILTLWIAPGIVLFVYPLWISKGSERERAQLELPLTERPASRTSENGSGLQGAHGSGMGRS